MNLFFYLFSNGRPLKGEGKKKGGKKGGLLRHACFHGGARRAKGGEGRGSGYVIGLNLKARQERRGRRKRWECPRVASLRGKTRQERARLGDVSSL